MTDITAATLLRRHTCGIARRNRPDLSTPQTAPRVQAASQTLAPPSDSATDSLQINKTFLDRADTLTLPARQRPLLHRPLFSTAQAVVLVDPSLRSQGRRPDWEIRCQCLQQLVRTAAAWGTSILSVSNLSGRKRRLRHKARVGCDEFDLRELIPR